jgi:putative DNA primase/helicase
MREWEDQGAVRAAARSSTEITLLDRIRSNPLRVAFEPDTIAESAKAQQRDPGFYEAIVELLRESGVRIRSWERAVKGIVDRSRASRSSAPEWHNRLVLTPTGAPKAALVNAILLLTSDPQWHGLLAFNEFTSAIETRSPPPWPDERVPAGEWTEADDIRLVCLLERDLSISLTPSQARAAVHNVASRSSYHPIRDWLHSLKWDAVSRLDTWLATYLGASEQPADYLSAVGRWFMIAAIARVMAPGCQVDHMMVLEGSQGLGKSSAARLLAGPAGYTSLGCAVGDKDSYLLLRGTWIGEFGELDGMSKSDVAKVKRYITDSTDAYRAPYARQVTRTPRQCVLIGSTNDAHYLGDSTGGRRFWPVRVGAIDLDGLRRDREMLWAEAVARYSSQERWWPSEEERAELEAQQDQRRLVDPWESRISTWLSGRTEATTNEVLGSCIGKEPKEWTRGDQMRIGAVLQSLGWERKRRMSDARREYVYGCPSALPLPHPVDTMVGQESLNGAA